MCAVKAVTGGDSFAMGVRLAEKGDVKSLSCQKERKQHQQPKNGF